MAQGTHNVGKQVATTRALFLQLLDIRCAFVRMRV